MVTHMCVKSIINVFLETWSLEPGGGVLSTRLLCIWSTWVMTIIPALSERGRRVATQNIHIYCPVANLWVSIYGHDHCTGHQAETKTIPGEDPIGLDYPVTIQTPTHTHARTDTHTNTHIHNQTNIHTHTHTHIHTTKQTNTHTHTH